MAFTVACATPATPVRPGDFPIAGGLHDARPDPVASRAPLVRDDHRDGAVSAAIRRGLAEDLGADAALVEVRVDDGDVVLLGSAMTARQRLGAEQVARAVTGVRSVRNRIVVRPVAVADDRVARDVRARLAQMADAGVDGITVSVERGVVTLSGQVPSPAVRQLVADSAAEVAGVVDVQDGLTVAVRGGSVGDEQLAADVRGRLARLAPGSVRQVDVRVQGGVVTLTGSVPTFALRRAIIGRAAAPGVRAVQHHQLRVAWQHPVAPVGGDQERAQSVVRAAVQDALSADPRLAYLAVNVRIVDGQVVLSGTVPTLELKRAAAAAADVSARPLAVDNQLQIDPARASDADLAAWVERALAHDAYLDHHTIEVRVHDGRVHLTGSVDAPFEVARASRLIERLPGVREVINALTPIPPRPAAQRVSSPRPARAPARSGR